MFGSKKNRIYKKGTSLVELMIFVLIVAILGSVTYPHILGMYRRACDASVKSNMFTLQIAAENFASMTHGMYPEHGVTTVGEVLTAMGFPGAVNLSRIADNCPGTGATVVTTPDALLPGNNTYYNHLFPFANSLDELPAVPGGPVAPPHHYIPGPGESGAGTVYWGPAGAAGTTAIEGYVIYGDSYLGLIYIELISE
ncbi:MAG: hypothetical protein E3J41_04245 [Candidatus Cloacimonadota bacterium]|nr:MAG: hypothetical protein E3J41_04245 [Candidatus Cloacimonadota bacterium]